MKSVNEAPRAPRVIAEIGCNHKGELDIALEMIEIAALFCKVDVVKFQKRSPRDLLSSTEYDSPHPNPANAYGDTYGSHREALELSESDHRKLKETCENRGIAYSSSVWDCPSAVTIAGLEPSFIKVPSACNQDFALIDWLCANYAGGLHISLGMTTREEEALLIDRLDHWGRTADVVLYACTSGYPVPFEDLYLLEVARLQETYGEVVDEIGFSGHHLGIAADIAAMAMGATWIERHFTLDRTWKGTDHAASLEPDGMRRLVRDARNVAMALRPKPLDELEIERTTREKLKRVSH